MPLLNDADEVYKGTVRVNRIYMGTTLVWPKIETWSAWYEVGTAVAGAPSAWFATGFDHYDTGAHERARFRYSNLGRVHWRGIMRNSTGAAAAAGALIITCNINDALVPDPVGITRMQAGPSGTAYASVLWGGGFTRFDAQPNATYHHQLVVANVDATAIANGGWFAIDGIFAFSENT